jgi:hypothetical protein
MRADFGLVREVIDGNLVVESPAESEPSPAPAVPEAEQLGFFGGSAP